MKRAAAAIALSLYALPAFAQTGDASHFPRQADVAVWMRDLLLQKMPGARIDYDSPGLIRARTPGGQELEIRTDSVWGRCVATPERCTSIAREHIDNVVSASGDQSAPIAREQLRVVVRSEPYVRDARASFARAPGGRAPIVRPVARGLWLVLVGDLPTSMRLVAADDLAPLGLGADEAIEQGRRNVARDLAAIAAKAKRDPRGFHVLAGDDYESSRALLHEAWAPLAREWKSALAIMVPGSRTVLYAPSSDRAAVEAMQAEGARLHLDAERRISNDLFHWTRSGWVNYRLPRAADTTADPPASALRLLEILHEAALALRDEYVDPIDVGRLAAGCEPRLAAWLGKAVIPGSRSGFSPADAGYASAEELAAPLYACIDLIARSLDRGTELRRGAGYRELTRSGAWATTGLVIERGERHPAVQVVHRPSPAADAGVRVGDEIVRVDGVSTSGMMTWDVGTLLRGAPGSSVRMTLRRAGTERELGVAREVLGEQQSEVAARGRAGVLVAKPAMVFGGALRLAETLVAAQPKGVVLDLRSHPGGLLDEAVAVAAAFLRPADVVARMQSRRGELVLRADRGDQWRSVEEVQRVSAALKGVPLVVLVDEYTASGAELVAGALQANKRARIVGRTTRGAGTVATIMPVGSFGANHMLKLTTSRIVTPDGRRIEGQGVAPDVRVEGDDEEQQLKAAERALAGGS